jgi:DnaK suppressor protein
MVTREQGLKNIEDVLREERENAETELAELDEQIRSFGDRDESSEVADNHPGDDSDRVSEQERLLTIRQQLGERKEAIEHAISKAGSGSFGICERCGSEIPIERLEVLPFARYCIECQEIVDEEEAAGP